MLWHSLNFTLHENQQRRVCAKHFLEDHFVELLVAQQSSAPHRPSSHDTQPQTNTDRSGRPQRLPPGYYQSINPVHLRTISTSNKMSFHGNRARVNQVRANRFAMQRIQYNSAMVTNTGPLTHHQYTKVRRPETANGGHVPL